MHIDDKIVGKLNVIRKVLSLTCWPFHFVRNRLTWQHPEELVPRKFHHQIDRPNLRLCSEWFLYWSSINLSMWMRAFAMRLVFNSSWAVNFERFPEKGEMFNEACLAINRSSFVNPRSGKIKSPEFILSKYPLFSIIALSLI